MDMVTASQVSHALGVSLPTAHKLLDKVGVPRVSRGHTRTAPAKVVPFLIGVRGATPRTTLRPTEQRILAVLVREPSGLPSARAIAVRASISPTTAARGVRSLVAAGLVRESEPRSVRRRITVHNKHLWPASLHAAVTDTLLPPVQMRRGPLPPHLHELVADFDVTRLDVRAHAVDVARVLLRSLDEVAWAWVVANLPSDVVADATPARGENAPSRQFIGRWLRGQQAMRARYG